MIVALREIIWTVIYPDGDQTPINQIFWWSLIQAAGGTIKKDENRWENSWKWGKL